MLELQLHPVDLPSALHYGNRQIHILLLRKIHECLTINKRLTVSLASWWDLRLFEASGECWESLLLGWSGDNWERRLAIWKDVSNNWLFIVHSTTLACYAVSDLTSQLLLCCFRLDVTPKFANVFSSIILCMNLT